MITKELVDFIKKMRIENHNDIDIQSMLVSNGWLAADVSEAFHNMALASQNTKTPPPPVAPVTPIVANKMPIDFGQQVNGFTPTIVATMPIKKSHKGLIIFFVILFIVLASGISAYFFRDKLFPVAEVPQTVAIGPAPVAPTPAPDLKAIASANCSAEVKTRLVKNDPNKFFTVVGHVDFVNPDFPYSSLNVSAGVFDKAQVKQDGSFCLGINTEIPATLVMVSPNDNNKVTILSALASAGSATNGLFINPESTAISFVDLSYAPFFTEEENNNIIKLIKSLPEGKDYIQSVVTIINAAKKDFNLETITANNLIVKKIQTLQGVIQKVPSTPELPNPILDKQKAAADRYPIIRDQNRIALMNVLKGGLEVYKSIKETDYPKSFEELNASKIASAPAAILPKDGSCTTAQNTFTYKYSPGTYSVSFCLGQSTQVNGVQYDAGVHTLTPGGIK